jgi:hypothetical protein
MCLIMENEKKYDLPEESSDKILLLSPTIGASCNSSLLKLNSPVTK